MHEQGRIALALALALAVAFAATLVVADVPKREPTPQEKAALVKAVAAIDKIVDPIASADWKKKGEFAKDDYLVSKEPSSPIDTAVDFERSYEIPENSALFKEKLMPVYMEAEKYANKGDMKKVQELTESTNGTMDFTVGSHINAISLPSSGKKIDVKGAAVAFESAPNEHPFEVVVAVGDWAKATPRGHLLEFNFAHPHGTPYVENIVFTFKTQKGSGLAADKIREIVRKTNWAELNKGLTR